MLKTFDILLILLMTATATVTYTIKHKAEIMESEVRRLDAAIKLEEDTIDLLRADWALLTQPSRLEALVKVYEKDLQLLPTASTQLARDNELPMLRKDLPPPEEIAETGKGKDKTKVAAKSAEKTIEEIVAEDAADNMTTGSVDR
ncbi:hypothetical protein SAMN05880582_1011122 [Rhizobium sp. RU20A]|uniref:cell division protein FtsL n=1 Tax=Rhizobium sp. RU20A TaxID=1907412 RepID=UPI000953E820|nr:hypothetical protein [Rhizobium sp. RU20A]SIQ21183.1 hypothetical protein SAMN05880582_1011122 [Rhizobium sp. RU20A]